jgi:Tfp pilus assembly protein PilF
MSHPANKYAATEEPLLHAGQRLLDDKPEQALVLFELDTKANPHSYRAYHALGYAYFKTGNKELAVKNLEKSLEMSPRNYEVEDLLRQVKKQ